MQHHLKLPQKYMERVVPRKWSATTRYTHIYTDILIWWLEAKRGAI